MEDERRPRLTRRRLVGAGVGTAAVGIGAGALLTDDGRPDTTTVGSATGERLARQFAPTLHFGAAERWLPTDPRRYAADRDGRTVVDGFDALSGYAADADAADGPPAPTVFWRVRRYEGTGLLAVQYWLYSAFDQFSVNFHWHDWELLQVFVDADTETPVLFAASAHSRRVPNNEYLDPAATTPSVVSEVGSHSSALAVVGRADTFQRLPAAAADVTNDLVGGLAFPFAYGLPRDEGTRLPYVVPELDGVPLFDHPELPDVERRHFVPPALTVREGEPPGELPAREPGLRLDPSERATGESVGYTLEPIAAVEIDAYEGPRLGFEFPVPGFAEDAVASHVTSVGTPQEQPRFDDPIADVTDTTHRRALADRYDVGDPGPLATAGAVVTRLREAVPDQTAPGDNGVQTREPRTEARALLESDPVAVPSFRGVVGVIGPSPGDHRLVVDAPDTAPYVERFTHEPSGAGAEPDDEATITERSETATVTATSDGATVDTDDTGTEQRVTAVGADGEAVLVPSAAAVKLRADASTDETPDLDRVTVTDDFGGTVYRSRPDPDGRAAVYVHRAGAYTAEVRDADGGVGAYRVNPGREQTSATVDRVRTGRRSLVDFLETFLVETRAQVAALRDGESVDDAVPAAARDPAAGRPASDDSGDDDSDDDRRGGGDGQPDAVEIVLQRLDRALRAARQSLSAIDDRSVGRLRGLGRQLTAIQETLDAGRSLPDGVAALLSARLDRLDRRVRQAMAAQM